jgi:hypothetical protein
VLSSDGASALGAELLAFCAHTGLDALQLRSRVTSSAAEVFFVASVNVLVQSATSGEAGVAQQLLRAGDPKTTGSDVFLKFRKDPLMKPEF